MTDVMLAPPVTSNAYWDAVKDYAKPGGYSWSPGYEVGSTGDWSKWHHRHEYTSTYSWTITDPATVAFVAAHLGQWAFDPLAGSGWWGLLLAERGVEVLSSDLAPPAPGAKNDFHRDGFTWVPMRQAVAADACRQWGIGRSLLLSWPPYDSPVGSRTLAAYPGDRVVYIGESGGGCCGDDEMHELLETEWVEVAAHRPVQWFGMHDYVTVYDRVQRRAVTR